MTYARMVFALAAATLGIAAGCASVTVRKVPSPTQYAPGEDGWSNADQRRADSMEGIRFYLPRPFVNVFESFPVATDIYLARGVVSPDGKWVHIDSLEPAMTHSDLSGKQVRTLMLDQIPTFTVFKAGAASNNAEARSAGIESDDLAAAVDEARKAATEAGNQADKAAEDRKAAEDAASKPDEPAPTTGRNARTVKNDNGAFAYQPLRGNFDIIYMPDFDEQYVISSQSNLGNAEFTMNIGQGWSLQGFNSLTDNSELNKRIFGLIDTAMQAAKAAAGAYIPGFGAVARSGDITATPDPDKRMDNVPGSRVALKIVVVHYAAKGIYPVIKPRELIGRAGPALVINLQDAAGNAVLPTNDEIARAVDLMDRHQRRFTTPVYPYQYISFNTFRYMAIEVLTPDGAPFGTLYDKTGTVGDSGDRRAGDPPKPGTPSPDGGPNAAAQTVAELAPRLLTEIQSTFPAISASDVSMDLKGTGAPFTIESVITTETGDPLPPAMISDIKAMVTALVSNSDANVGDLRDVVIKVKKKGS